MIKRSLCVQLFLLVACSQLAAQTENTSHLFPQIPDGRQLDGSYYVSQFWITNLSPLVAACTINLYGLSSNRLTTAGTFSIAAGAWAAVRSRGVDPLATGYARLDCTQPVTASVTYSLTEVNGQTAGMATVLSSPLSSYAVLPMLLGPNLRYGVAIANDSDLPAVISLIFTHSTGQGGGKVIQIAPRSHRSVFADEELTLPVQGSGSLEVQANGTVGSGNFNMIGFLFDQNVFTTLIPATNR